MRRSNVDCDDGSAPKTDDESGKKKRKKRKARSKDSTEETNAEAEAHTDGNAAKESVKEETKETTPASDAAEPAQKKQKKAPKTKKPQAKAAGKLVAPGTTVHKHVDLPKWAKFKLHNTLMQSLERSGFVAPTRIQEKTIYPALVDNRDVVGAAPTGSGKTLAFGLPILSILLSEKGKKGYTKDCKALILTPTRELAMQIHNHLGKMVPNREIGIVTLVGGMASQKQKRMLAYGPEIVIGTPGRLWDLIQDSQVTHLQNLSKTLRFLVIDEADRMLQKGSYPEVENIFEELRHGGKSAASELVDMSEDEEEEEEDEEEDEEDDDGEDIAIDGASKFSGGANVMMLDDILKKQKAQKQKQEAVEEEDEEDSTTPVQAVTTPVRFTRQTYLFSATLTIPEGGRFQKDGQKKHRNALTVLESVMKRVGLRGKPAVVDLSIDERADSDLAPEQAKKRSNNVALSLPAGLELCQHEITDANRDSFLYYFLTQYPGRTIVFLNAIHQVRRLSSLLSLLKLPVFALHAEMQQRQRLKKLDSFRAHAQGILIATDVAARGLDIPSVDYVVHYHIARSTEVFVHRSGRTARAEKEGLSISLVSPVDMKNHLQICKMLQRPTGLSDFPFDHRYLPPIDERVRIAKAINDQENASGKVKSEETWFSQMAAAADLDMDEDLLFELKSKKDNQGGSKVKPFAGESVASLRNTLSRLVAEPLRPIGSSRKFRQLYQEIGSELAKDGEYRKRDASEDLATKSKKAYKRFRRRG